MILKRKSLFAILLALTLPSLLINAENESNYKVEKINGSTPIQYSLSVRLPSGKWAGVTNEIISNYLKNPNKEQLSLFAEIFEEKIYSAEHARDRIKELFASTPEPKNKDDFKEIVFAYHDKKRLEEFGAQLMGEPIKSGRVEGEFQRLDNDRYQSIMAQQEQCGGGKRGSAEAEMYQALAMLASNKLCTVSHVHVGEIGRTKSANLCIVKLASDISATIGFGDVQISQTQNKSNASIPWSGDHRLGNPKSTDNWYFGTKRNSGFYNEAVNAGICKAADEIWIKH